MKDATITPSELDELFQKFDKAPDSYVFVPLADACRKIGRVEEALEICDAGISRHPSYASGYVVRGKCLYDLKRTADAKSAFQRVLDLDADNLVALKYLGRIEADKDNFDGARDYFKHILVLDPDNKEISDVLLAVEERERSELAGAASQDSGRSQSARDDDLDSNAALHTGDTGESSAPAVEEPAARDREGDRVHAQPTELGDGEDDNSDESAAIALADIFASQGYDERARKIYQQVLSKQPNNREVRRKLDELDGWQEEAPAGEYDDSRQRDIVDDTEHAAVADGDYDDTSAAIDEPETAHEAAADSEEPVAIKETEHTVVVLGAEGAAETQELDDLPKTIQLGPVEDFVEETDEVEHEVAEDLDTSLEETAIIMPAPPAVEETDPVDEVEDLDLDVANPDVIHLPEEYDDPDTADTEQEVAEATLEVEDPDEAIEVTVSEILEDETPAEGFQEIGAGAEETVDATPSRTVTTRRKRRRPKPPLGKDEGRKIDEKEGMQHFRRWINHIAD